MSDKNIMEKTKKAVLILIPVIIVVAIGWSVVKFFAKKKSGADASVNDTVKEGVAFIKRALNVLNGHDN